MKVLFIGTGYVGLNTGVALAYLGHQVTCLDVVPEKIAILKSGRSYMYEPHLDTMLPLAAHNMTFTTSYDEADIPHTDVVFIAVGTPSLPDGSANLEYVARAAQSIGCWLGEHFTVIVNKSTVPIGSGNWVSALVKTACEQSNGGETRANFAVVSNPEFLRQGSALTESLYPDRIVIGTDNPQALKVLTDLYRLILEQDFEAPECLPRKPGFTSVPLLTCDIASAEMIKYAANAFLALKISYINEIAHLAEKVGADISQIARGIGMDERIGPKFLNPGIGWGGSCFGKDTAALISTAHKYHLEMPIVQAAREVNYQQRTWVVKQLQEELKMLEGRRIALLGFSFKPNTDDLRDAPSVDIARLLIQNRALVRAHDPVALKNARKQYPDLGVKYCDDVYEALAGADAIVLVTEWPEYRELDWSRLKPVPVVDGRNFLDAGMLKGLGFTVIGVGR